VSKASRSFPFPGYMYMVPPRERDGFTEGIQAADDAHRSVSSRAGVSFGFGLWPFGSSLDACGCLRDVVTINGDALDRRYTNTVSYVCAPYPDSSDGVSVHS
jgi:hypothetical protein